MPAELDQLLSPALANSRERDRLIRLMSLFAELPGPPDPFGLFPSYGVLHRRFLAMLRGTDAFALEESFLLLYAHLHGYEVPLTLGERTRFERGGGHLCHAGGVSPMLKAGSHIQPTTVSADFGAGNGLQGLLFQVLDPHQKTVQIEISSRLVESGRQLQRWLGVPDERVEWVVGDIADVSPAEMDFVYLYRPVRPLGPGEQFYRDFAAQLCASQRDVVVFSVADCLRRFLQPRFEVFYSDGHLTCFGKAGSGRHDPSGF